jgi:Holliday junction DNA helicase RuvA
VATNILSSISPAELVSAISSGELSKKKIPGIGSKLASRLVTELKDKALKIQPKGEVAGKAGILEDVISALLNLGYTKSEIDEHILQLEELSANENDIEMALRESLKVMRKV